MSIQEMSLIVYFCIVLCTFWATVLQIMTYTIPVTICTLDIGVALRQLIRRNIDHLDVAGNISYDEWYLLIMRYTYIWF